MSRSVLCFGVVLLCAGVAIAAESKFTYKVEVTNKDGKPGLAKLRLTGTYTEDDRPVERTADGVVQTPHTYTTTRPYSRFTISATNADAKRIKVTLIRGDEKTGKVVAEEDVAATISVVTGTAR